MAGVLKSSSVPDNIFISILVVCPVHFGSVIAEGLHEIARARKCRILVHECELISDIIRKQGSLHVDFIVFAYDPRSSQTLKEVEINITKIEEQFIVCGWACLVNGCGIGSAAGVEGHLIWEIRMKYNLPFYTADIFDSEDCLHLCDSILRLAESRLGLRSGFPALASSTRIQKIIMQESEQ